MEMEKNREKLEFNSEGLEMEPGIHAEYNEEILQSESMMTSFIFTGKESKVDFPKSSMMQQKNLLLFDEQGDIISRKIMQKQEQESLADSSQIVVGSDSYLPGCSYDEFFDVPKKMASHDESNSNCDNSKNHLFSMDLKIAGLIDFDAGECFHSVMKENLLLNSEDSHGKVLDSNHIAEESNVHTVQAKNSRLIDDAPDMKCSISLQNHQSSCVKLLKLSTIAKNAVRKSSMQTCAPQGINEKYNVYEKTIAATRAKLSLPEQLEVIAPFYESHGSDSDREQVKYTCTRKEDFRQAQTVGVSVESGDKSHNISEFDEQGDYAMFHHQSRKVKALGAGENEKMQIPHFFSDSLCNSSQGFQSVNIGFISDRKMDCIENEVIITDLNKSQPKKLQQMNCALYKNLSDLNRVPTLKELAQYISFYADLGTEAKKFDPLHRSGGTSGSDVLSVNYDGNMWCKPFGEAPEKNECGDIAANYSKKCFCADDEKTIVSDPNQSDLDSCLVLNCHEREIKRNNRMPFRWSCYETSGKTKRNHDDGFSVHEKNDCAMSRLFSEEMYSRTIEKTSATKNIMPDEDSFAGETSETSQVPGDDIHHQRSQSNVQLDFSKLTELKSLGDMVKAQERCEKSSFDIHLTDTPDGFSKYQSPFQSTSDPSLESSSYNSTWNCSGTESPCLTVMDIIKHQLYFQAEGLSDWLKQFLPPEYYASNNSSKYPFRLDKFLDEEVHVDRGKNKVVNQPTSDWSIEVSGQNNHEGCFEYKYHPWSVETDEQTEKKNLVFSESSINRDRFPDLNLEKVTQVKYTRDYLLKLSNCILAYAFPEALRPFAKNMELPLKQLPYLEQPQNVPDVPLLPNVSYHSGMDHILFYQNVNYTSHLRRTENRSPN